ncbi:HVA22 domain membrane protein [Talaromyces stipitatus ATCC 10500]|uniref:Protein YOP1 n=1 Tax=Talaromyces stipitatus (strain ATCC 10500 / CBS 375.48 / QM 6759 / NRRL 1006) TaxID=441959 RepID=B8MCA2_TALSN|nr:HVA22 domain membrane protein [Talaromyces stipitatus ATCC 10500]EED18548.1 HVA22 domain membrane protein [Talaromyces stipitatus ATCC 10500]
MFGIFADLLSSVITILFPAFASYKAIRSGNPAQLTPWLMYWVVLSGILLAESWTVFIIGWFPFYSWIRLFFLSYLVLPQTQGARILFQEYLDPFFEQHEREIEEFIGRSHERAKALGLQYFYQLIDIIREKVLGLPSQQQQAPPPPQPAGAAGYAQALLSRFNLPSPANVAPGAAAGSGADWFSMVTSALGAVTSTTIAQPQSREAQVEQLSASGVLNTEQYRHLSRSQKARLYSSQRERLEVLVSALEKEESKLHVTPGSSEDASDDDLAYGSGPAGLRKNASEHSFDQIDDDDLTGSRYTSNEAATGGGWASGWFGGSTATGESHKRPSTGSKRNVSDSVDFAARSVDEIGRASGFSR